MSSLVAVRGRATTSRTTPLRSSGNGGARTAMAARRVLDTRGVAQRFRDDTRALCCESYIEIAVDVLWFLVLDELNYWSPRAGWQETRPQRLARIPAGLAASGFAGSRTTRCISPAIWMGISFWPTPRSGDRHTTDGRTTRRGGQFGRPLFVTAMRGDRGRSAPSMAARPSTGATPARTGVPAHRLDDHPSSAIRRKRSIGVATIRPLRARIAPPAHSRPAERTGGHASAPAAVRSRRPRGWRREGRRRGGRPGGPSSARCRRR